MKKLVILFNLMLVVLLSGCFKTQEDGIAINGIKDIEVGETLQLTLDISNKDNKEVSGATWSSYNEEIATVSRSGEVAGIKFGTTKIEVEMTIGETEFKTSVYLNVGNKTSNKEDGIEILSSEDTIQAAIGDVIHLDYSISNKDNKEITDLTWSSNFSRLTVDENGVVTAHSAGIAMITLKVKIGGVEYKDSVNFFVSETSNDPVNVKITGSKNLYVNDTVQLDVTYTNPDNNAVSNKVWSVDNDNVEITENGLVTAKKVGSSTITFTARIGNKSYSNSVMIIVLDSNTGGDSNLLYLQEGVVETSDPKVNEKVELSYSEVNSGYIESNFNPYDYEEIKAEATIVDPNNDVVKMPLYWGYDSTINLNSYTGNASGNNGVASNDKNEIQGKEMFYYEKTGEYFLRFNPKVSGTHRVIVRLYINGKSTETISQEVNINENSKTNRGVISVDTTNNRTLIDENNKTFISNGMNQAWYTSSTRASYDYQVWFEKSSANNINTTRIWLAQWGMTIRGANTVDNFTKSVGAERFDHILEQAEANEIYIQLTLNHHGQFTEYTNTVWKDNPYNKANGGMLDNPYDFFSDEEAKAAYKNELMYIIARYGYSDYILAWELFNEVDYTYYSDYNTQLPNGAQLATDVKNWHEEMGTFIKANDPYNHMVTTSYKAATGSAFYLDVIDYTNIHNYGFYQTSGYFGKNDVNSLLDQMPKEAISTSSQYKKPVFHSEVGVNYENGSNTAKEDPNAISIHQSLYAGFLGGGIGGGMQWWWDSWIHPQDLYSKYAGAGEYANMIDLTGSDYSVVTHGSNTVTSSNGDLHMFGYLFNDRSYGYVYDSKYNHWSTNSNVMTNQTLTLTIDSGNYTVQYFDPLTNNLIHTLDATSTNGKLVLNLPTFTNEMTYILTKK